MYLCRQNDVAFFALGTPRGKARLGILRYSQVFQGHVFVEEVVGHSGQLIAIKVPFGFGRERNRPRSGDRNVVWLAGQ